MIGYQDRKLVSLPEVVTNFLHTTYEQLRDFYPDNSCGRIAREIYDLLSDSDVPSEILKARRWEVVAGEQQRVNLLPSSHETQWFFHCVVSLGDDIILDPAFSPLPILKQHYLELAYPNQLVELGGL